MKLPLYRKIAAHIKEKIVSGEYPAGTKLSQRERADYYRVSRHPVAEAFELLQAEGLVEMIAQSGTIVTNNPWLNFNRKKESSWMAYLQSGRYKHSSRDIDMVFTKMQDSVSQKLVGDRLASTFNPHLPFVKAMDKVARRLEHTGDLGYFDRSGLGSLKTALCQHMRRQGIYAGEDEILVTGGIGESLGLLAGSFLGNGLNFVYETPSFINSTMLIHSSGCNMHEIPLDPEGIDAEKLAVKLRRTKDAILYIQPVNHLPTGTHMTRNRRNTVLSIVTDLKIPTIENDMFRDFYFRNPFPRPLKAFDANHQIIYIGSLLSGFMGYKLSWIMAAPAIIECLKKLNTHQELISNVFVQMFAEEMLTSGYYYEYLDMVRPLMNEHYEHVHRLLDLYLADIAVWRRDYPSYYVWLAFDKKINVFEKFKTSEDYLYYPGMMFNPEDRSHIRLNIFGAKRENLEEWIKRISLLMRS